ncbi:hypothetical protein JOQ06_017512 [Pogonophryne albipinna]|uniref:Uncharacterized protein n=1 Tax=Pogonophryne albipinna TaxID=1090488 RepID=A0AAD6FJI6_9TELE|nr:hypothetical protein JOQ06_017512 [Pogonophryne albipinna]
MEIRPRAQQEPVGWIVIVRCCFSGKDACVSLLTGRKHSPVDERTGTGFNLPCRRPAGAVNKMRLHSPFVQSSLLAAIKLSANPEERAPVPSAPAGLH